MRDAPFAQRLGFVVDVIVGIFIIIAALALFTGILAAQIEGHCGGVWHGVVSTKLRAG